MSASVPFDFDMEDEDFMSRDALDIRDRDGMSGLRGTSRGVLRLRCLRLLLVRILWMTCARSWMMMNRMLGMGR